MLSLDPNADDETVIQAMWNRIAEAEVVAAIKDRKILAAHKEPWLTAFKADFDGSKAVLASLSPGSTGGVVAAAARSDVNSELERVHGQVLARLGITPPAAKPAPSRTVAASYPPSNAPVVRDMLGLPIPPVPPPVRISKGVPRSQWTRQQEADYVQRRLGQRFWPGTTEPPKGDVWHWPDPNAPYEFVETADGEGFWREKPNYTGSI
ncbi:MAG: hypothetical protein ACRECA_08645 [Pseudolabrys sp.]